MVAAAPNMTNRYISITNVTMSEIQVEFEQADVNSSLAQYYEYEVDYSTDGSTWTTSETLTHDPDANNQRRTVLINGLSSGTRYTIRIVPFRTFSKAENQVICQAGLPNSITSATSM